MPDESDVYTTNIADLHQRQLLKIAIF